MGDTRTADVGAAPGKRGPERRAAVPGTLSRLGDLAASAVRVPSSTRLAALDALFRRVPDITHPDDLATDRADVAELEAGRAVVQEVAERYRRPDGSDVPVVQATVVDGRRGEPAHVFAHVLPQ